MGVGNYMPWTLNDGSLPISTQGDAYGWCDAFEVKTKKLIGTLQDDGFEREKLLYGSSRQEAKSTRLGYNPTGGIDFSLTITNPEMSLSSAIGTAYPNVGTWAAGNYHFYIVPLIDLMDGTIVSTNAHVDLYQNLHLNDLLYIEVSLPQGTNRFIVYHIVGSTLYYKIFTGIYASIPNTTGWATSTSQSEILSSLGCIFTSTFRIDPSGIQVGNNAGVGKVLQSDSSGYGNWVDMPMPDLSGYVPFTGAASAVELNAQDLVNVANIGVGTSTPAGELDIQASTTITIDDVTSSDILNFNYLTGAYTSQGNSYQFDVYAYKTVGAVRIYSSTPATFANDDGAGGHFFENFTISFSWDAVTGAEGYRVVVVQDGESGYANNAYYETTSTSTTIGTYDIGLEDTCGYYVYESPPTVTPNSVSSGASFTVDGTSGSITMIGATSITGNVALNGGITQSGTSVNTFTGPLDVNTDTPLYGTDATFRVRNTNPGIACTFAIEGASYPKWQIKSGSAPANAKIYQIYENPSGDLVWGMVNDTYSAENWFMCFQRTGATPTAFTFAGGIKVGFSGTPGSGGTSYSSPTARVHLPGGSTSANTSPLKFTSGSLLTTAEIGAMEFLTDRLYFSTGNSARKEVVLNNGTALTSGKIPICSTNGRLIDGQTPLSGTKIYYVSDTSGGTVNRKLTFVDGILTSQT
jgi:hypothetical protein